jgi:putative transposase
MNSSIAQEREFDQNLFYDSLDSAPYRADLDQEIRGRLRVWIEDILNEELDGVLGAQAYERHRQRVAYRNGTRDRTITCQAGTREISVPRARLFEGSGNKTREYHSEFMPYYKRRTEAVDETLLGTYLAGASTRKVKKALAPLWKEGPLSKSAVSRLTPRIKARLEEFNHRDLSGRTWLYLYLDAIFLKVRMADKVVKVPVLAVLGVDITGKKELLVLSLWSKESSGAWFWVCQGLKDRGLVEVALRIIDGNPGLRDAVARTWAGADVQRCTVHKERNLLDKAPKHARDEVKADYQAIVYADSEKAARRAWTAFEKKWQRKLPMWWPASKRAGRNS